MRDRLVVTMLAERVTRELRSMVLSENEPGLYGAAMRRIKELARTDAVDDPRFAMHLRRIFHAIVRERT